MSAEASAFQLALDLVSIASRAGMPETYWQSDSRIARACSVLGITSEEARALPADIYLTGLSPQSAAEPDRPDLHRVGVPLEVWTDGACSGNPGPGGWGWVTNETGGLEGARHGHGGDIATTNQRMEIQAVLEALQAIPERPIVVVSDSRYVVDGFQKSWWKGWLKNGWMTSQGKPVANRDLWEPLVPLAAPADVSFRWVKGHAGNHLNEVADSLAVQGRNESSAAKQRQRQRP